MGKSTQGNGLFCPRYCGNFQAGTLFRPIEIHDYHLAKPEINTKFDVSQWQQSHNVWIQ